MLKFYMWDIDTTTRKLELEQRRLHKLNKDLAAADVEHGVKRGLGAAKKEGRSHAGDQTMRPRGLAQERTRGQEVRQLEKHLEKAIGDLNQSTNDNEQLMKQIDQLRKERLVLDSVFQGMTRNIGRKRAEGDKLRATILGEAQQSEEASHRQNALGKILGNERKTFQAQRMRLKTQVQEQGRVQREQAIASHPGGERARPPAQSTRRPAPASQEALGDESAHEAEDERSRTKKEASEQDRTKKVVIAYHPAGKGKDGGSYTIADEEEEFSEQAMHRRILKLSFLNTIQRRHIKQHQKNIEVFEQAFATIKSSTQIHEIDEIVRIFVELEQRNFSLLTYVNQLNREIEAIEIRKRELQHSLDTHEQDEINSKHRKEVVLKDVRAQIDRTRQAVAEKDKMIEDSSKAVEDCRRPVWLTVQLLKKEIPRLTKSGYEGEAPVMKQFPPNEDESLSHQLAYIEEAVLQFRAALGDTAVSRAQPLPAARAGLALSGHKKPLELPSAQNINDDSDEEGDPSQPGLGDRPLDLQELRKRAMEKEKDREKRRKQRSGAVGRQTHAQDQGADEEETPDLTVRSQKRETALPTPKDAGGSETLGSASLSKSPSAPKQQPDTPKEQSGESVEWLRKEMWWRDTSMHPKAQ